jgi:non-ribosomal peptide synthetase component F
MIFEEQVRRRSSQIAIIHREQVITYNDLNLRANHLVSYLKSLEFGQGEIIAVCLDYRPECIAALMALAQLECPCLMVDPSWPKADKTSQLEGAGVACILTMREFAANLPANILLVYMDEWARVIAAQSQVHLPRSYDPKGLH